VLGAEVVGPPGRFDDEHVAVSEPPRQAGLVEHLVDRSQVLVEHDPRPCQGMKRTLNMLSLWVMP
jgi:hypothetical protein